MVVINRLQDHGGAEVSTLTTLAGLQGEEFDFRVVTLFGPVDFQGMDELIDRGLEIVTAPDGFLRQLRFLDREVSHWQPDLLHSTLFDSDMVARLVGLRRRVPVLSSLVNTEFSDEAYRLARSPWRLRVIQILCQITGLIGVSRFHAISEATAEHGRRKLHIPEWKISVVVRGRDDMALGRRTEERRRRARSDLDLSDSTFVVLNAARREPQKGQVFLLEAFARLLDERPDSVLLVAGREGQASEQLRRVASKYGLETSVRFLGTRSDIAELMCACDAFVLSSLWEGLGGVLVEALALEAPIVSFRIDAAAEVVGEFGQLVGVGNVAELTHALERVAADPPWAREVAARGRVRFEERYSNELMLRNMASLYRTVADEPAPPRFRIGSRVA